MGLRRGVGLLVAVVLGGISLALAPLPASGADGLQVCSVQPRPSGEGEAELTISRETWKGFSRSRVAHRLIQPASSLGGRPVYPVESGSVDGSVATARLAGGFTLTSARGRKVRVVINRLVRNGSSARLEGRVAGRRMTVFRVKRSRLELNPASGRVEVLGGRTVMSSRFASIARKKAGLRSHPPQRTGALR